jgi:hypothetical protein
MFCAELEVSKIEKVAFRKNTYKIQTSATAIGAVRFKFNLERNFFQESPSDWTYSIQYCLNHGENNITIMLACLPPLRAFFMSLTSNSDEESQRPIQRTAQAVPQTLNWESFSRELRPIPEGSEDSLCREMKGQTTSSSLQTSTSHSSGLNKEMEIM